MSVKKNTSTRKGKKTSAKYTVLFFSFVLFSCFLLIVVSSIFVTNESKSIAKNTTNSASQTNTPEGQSPSRGVRSKNVSLTEKDAPQQTSDSIQSSSRTQSTMSTRSSNTNSDLPQATIPRESSGLPLHSTQPLGSTKNRGKVVIVLDDGGHNLSQVEPFLRLPFPLTIAVLPGLAYSKETASLVRNAGKEVMLHQPMQALNLEIDPGPSSIQPKMTETEIRNLLEKNLAEVAPVVGMNNHEGSLITADAKVMGVVLDFCKEHNLFFLDSRTTGDTKVPVVAKEKNIHAWERNVFLDNTSEKADIVAMFKAGLEIAEKDGLAIMIGHVWSGEHFANILLELGTEAIENGFEFTTIPALK